MHQDAPKPFTEGLSLLPAVTAKANTFASCPLALEKKGRHSKSGRRLHQQQQQQHHQEQQQQQQQLFGNHAVPCSGAMAQSFTELGTGPLPLSPAISEMQAIWLPRQLVCGSLTGGWSGSAVYCRVSGPVPHSPVLCVRCCVLSWLGQNSFVANGRGSERDLTFVSFFSPSRVASQAGCECQ